MRFKTKCKKIIVVTALIVVGIMVIGGGTTKAALQANATTHAIYNSTAKKVGAYFMEEIRKMETSGQTMGLNETLNDDLSPKTSNGIDVHMMRTTEYGAMAILSASGFGNPKKLSEATIKSTTGNVTGVYVAEDKRDWTAGVMSAATVGKNTRYYDLYTATNESAKPGDALGTGSTTNKGCARWHGATYSGWLDADTNGFICGGSSGGIFNFRGSNCMWSENPFYGRGVAVVGQGL